MRYACKLEMMQSNFQCECQKYNKFIQHHKFALIYLGIRSNLCLVWSVRHQNVKLCLTFEKICGMLLIHLREQKETRQVKCSSVEALNKVNFT